MKEDKYTEFKQQVTNTFLKTVSAYANYGRGRIVFGVKDNGEIVGIDDPDQTSLDIENKINDSIKPRPDYCFSINRTTNVITLTVEEGSFKPYLYKGKAYNRSGTSTVEVDHAALKRLVLRGENLYFEQLPVDEQNLSFSCLSDALTTKVNIGELTIDSLKTLGLYNADNRYNQAALLLSDENSFPGIDIVRFGASVNEIQYRETLKNISILEQLSRAEEIFERFYKIEEIAGMERNVKYLVPIESFREAVANALVHRTWDTKAHIRISMYADKIDIFSPGGLPEGITKEEYLHGYLSNLRNPVIANVFFRLGIIEMFGTGIRRIRESYRDIAHKPVFDVADNSIAVILPTVTKKENLSTDEKQILESLPAGMRLASSEIVQRVGFSKDKVVRLVNSLIEKNYIAKEGSGRGTKYYSL